MLQPYIYLTIEGKDLLISSQFHLKIMTKMCYLGRLHTMRVCVCVYIFLLVVW